MRKKTYIQPVSEIMPFGTMVALCVSGETTDELGGGNSGANPWTGGMAPPYPKPF